MTDLADWQRWWKHFGAVELNHLLLVWWDPIGVYGVPDARDEYSTYAGTIGRMLREGADAGALSAALRDAEDRMGIAPPSNAPQVVARILEWYAEVEPRLAG